MTAMITERQTAFIAKSLDERVLPYEEATRPAVEAELPAMDTRRASKLISYLLSLPKRVVATTIPAQPTGERVTEVGVYETPDGEIFVVKHNREKTRLYAKKLVEIRASRATVADGTVNIEFEYAPGAIYKLTPAMKMPRERAEQLTIRYGRCIVCNRALKDAKSVRAGIGPVCGKYYR